jgi:hypothetical protein
MFILTQKKCTKCGEVKPLDEFKKDKRRPDGASSWCKPCAEKYAKAKNYPSKRGTKEAAKARRKRYVIKNRERVNAYNRNYRKDHKRPVLPETSRDFHLRRAYGISLAEYESMLEQQGGVCLICGCSSLDRRFHVDHNHETGKIRGLLCHNCNVAIGLISDNPTVADRMAAYLRGGVKNA